MNGLSKNRGFTLIELIMTMTIVGILAVFVAPRFFDSNVFKSKGFADQVQASLRYAQKEAIAQRCFACVTFTTNSISLAIGATNICGTNLAFPAGGNSITAPVGSGITYTTSLVSTAPTTPLDFNFNALGQPSLAQTIFIVGAPNSITVEAETGYVHSP